jgi:hypothetical protein
LWVFRAGLPDGIFSYKKIPILIFFEGLGVEMFGKFDGHLVSFVVCWSISPRFGMLYQHKSGNPHLVMTWPHRQTDMPRLHMSRFQTLKEKNPSLCPFFSNGICHHYLCGDFLSGFPAKNVSRTVVLCQQQGDLMLL